MSLQRALFAIVSGVLTFAVFNRGGGPFASHVVLTFGTMLCLGLTLFRSHISFFKGEDFAPRALWLHAVYGLFCGVVLLSIIFGDTPEYGLSEFLLFANGGVLMFLFSGLSYREQDLSFFLKATLGVVLLITCIGFYYYITTATPRLAGTFFQDGLIQQAAFNAYANVLILVLPAALFYALTLQGRTALVRLVILAAGVLLTALVLSFSRAAYLSLLVCTPALFMLVKCAKKTVRIMPRLLIIVLIAVSAFALMQTSKSIYYRTTSLFDKLFFVADEGANSATERLDYWKAAVNIIREHPVLGSGVLSFRFLYPEYQSTFGINEDHPHNIFLKVGVENGVFAVLALIIFSVGVGYYLIRSFLHFASTRNEKTTLLVGLVLACGAVVALAHNLLDYNLIVSNYLLLTVFVGIFLGNVVMPKSTPRIVDVVLSLVSLLSLCMTLVVIHEAYYNRSLQLARAGAIDGTAETEAHLVAAQNLIFKRDFYQIWSDFYRAKFIATQDQQWLEKEREALSIVTIENVIDADLYARFGSNYALLYQENSYIEYYDVAYTYLCMALQRDPQNDINTYYQFALLQKIKSKKTKKDFNVKLLNETLAPCGGRDAVVLLNEYRELLKQNRHFTSASGNPAAASFLLELLGMAQEKEKFDALWQEKKVEWALLNNQNVL